MGGAGGLHQGRAPLRERSHQGGAVRGPAQPHRADFVIWLALALAAVDPEGCDQGRLVGEHRIDIA